MKVEVLIFETNNPLKFIAQQEVIDEFYDRIIGMSGNISLSFPTQKSGYRGLVVTSGVDRIRVYGGVVSVESCGVERVFVDSGRLLESWLIDQLKKEIGSWYDTLIKPNFKDGK